MLREGKLNGKPIQDVLHVMRRYDENEGEAIVAEFDTFLNRITTTPATSQRGLIIAELRGVDASKYGFVVKLRQTKRTFFASKGVIETAAASFRSAWAMVGDFTARVVALAVIERTKDGNLRIVDRHCKLCSSGFSAV